MNMSEDQYNLIIEKLDKIMRLLTLDALKEKQTQKEKILFLHSLDFKPLEISKKLSTSSNTVNVRLSEARKEGIIE